MNILKGKVERVSLESSLSLVEVDVNRIKFYAMCIENASTSYLEKGASVRLMFKETTVIVGKGLNHSISIENKIAGCIFKIEKGKILSKVVVHTCIGHITAIISTERLHQMQFNLEDEVTAMIATTAIKLVK